MPKTGFFLIFIVLVILIYSGLNYYFIRKNLSLIAGRPLLTMLLGLLLFTVILAPVATTIFSYHEIPLLAALTGFTGYGWLAFLFLFLLIHGSVDIVIYLTEKAGFIPPGYMAREMLIVTLVLSGSVLAYGFHEAKDIRVERVVIETDKLPAGTDELKIFQITDVHFSPLISSDCAEKLKSIAAAEKPDLILSTGDILDRAIRNPGEVIKIMQSIKAPLGKYAVTGNHEFIAGIEDSVKFIERAGFILLRNRTVSVDGIINLAGVDDRDAARFGMKPGISEKDVLTGIDRAKYTVLMKHQPFVDKTTSGMFDLQLSGHTHAGQIFPFRYIVKMIYSYTAGLYDLGGGAKIYVSRGTGTWGPPVRVLAPPEVTVIILKRRIK